MKRIDPSATIPQGTYIATVGFFDGVHLGHRYLLNLVKNEAVKLGKKSLVISFENHPKTILPTNYVPALLTNNEEKMALLADFGIDACVLLPFNKQMANLSAYDFIKQHLVKQMGVHTLFIGYDNRFGKNRQETMADYMVYAQELGLRIIEASPFLHKGVHISSSVIRKLIEKGQMDAAAELLSYPYQIEGTVVNGQHIGKRIGFPTANIVRNVTNKILPPHGVYAVEVLLHTTVYGGMLNIGVRPTLSDTKTTSIEVHILDFNQTIYNEQIAVRFIGRMRDEISFTCVDELIAQLDRDKQHAIALLEKNRAV